MDKNITAMVEAEFVAEMAAKREADRLRRKGLAAIARGIGSLLLDIDQAMNQNRGALARFRRRALGEPASLSRKLVR